MSYLFAFLGNLQDRNKKSGKSISVWGENEASATLESKGSCPYKGAERGKAETHIAVNMIIPIKRQRSPASD